VLNDNGEIMNIEEQLTSQSLLKPNQLWNPRADTSSVSLIGGDTTGMMVLTNNKYNWSMKLYRAMMGNFWVPEEIKLGADAGQYKQLSPDEQDAFDKIISFLIFMDSLLTSAIPSINDYITIPEVKLLLSIHAFQEALHSQSYGYILETVVSAEKRRHIYDLALKDEQMKARNSYIANFYHLFNCTPTPQNFLSVVMAEYLLESIYFYSGFAFFYNLARQGKMTGVATEIKYINRDEVTHMTLFQNIFKELRNERPELFTRETEQSLREMCRTAVEHEIAWATYAFANVVSGLNVELIDTYIKYLSNNRLRNLKLEPIWPEIQHNPIPFVTTMSSFNATKTDFFEEKPINYSKAGADLKLDDLDELDF